MMGKSHAVSAAVGWVAGCAVLQATGVAPANCTVVVGAAVAAGFGLVPDVDHPDSTIARTLGPATRLLAVGVGKTAAYARTRSCRHCLTGPDRGGHRGLTHTAVGALAAGLAVSVAAGISRTAALAVVGFAVWLAVHTILSSKHRAKIGDMILPGRFRRHGRGAHRFTAAVGAAMIAAAATAITDAAAPDSASWWWLGIAVGWGCLAHILGDAMTYSAVPLCWPIRIRGCRWTPVGTPRWMRFRTGSGAETVLVMLLSAAGIGAVVLLGAVG